MIQGHSNNPTKQLDHASRTQPAFYYWRLKTCMIAQKLEETTSSYLTDATDVTLISFTEMCHCNLVGIIT